MVQAPRSEDPTELSLVKQREFDLLASFYGPVDNPIEARLVVETVERAPGMEAVAAIDIDGDEEDGGEEGAPARAAMRGRLVSDPPQCTEVCSSQSSGHGMGLACTCSSLSLGSRMPFTVIEGALVFQSLFVGAQSFLLSNSSFVMVWRHLKHCHGGGPLLITAKPSRLPRSARRSSRRWSLRRCSSTGRRRSRWWRRGRLQGPTTPCGSRCCREGTS